MGTHRGAAALTGHLGVHNVAGRIALGVADALPQRAHAAPLLAANLREDLQTASCASVTIAEPALKTKKRTSCSNMRQTKAASMYGKGLVQSRQAETTCA